MFANQSQVNSFYTPAPALTGSCGYEVQNDRVVITISEIINQRELGNISGTLSIELWALDNPYTGSGFNGLALAGTGIGELFGQHSLSNCRYELSFQEPPAGTWYLTLMLREWTEMGYVTRDYINFAQPYVVGSRPDISRSDTDNVINVSFIGGKNSQPLNNAETTASPATDEISQAASKPQANASISLNSASLKDINSIKGISKKLAENIAAARPFQTPDEVLKVKGMGPKLWQKIRKFITL